jgi:hypothetical protein
VTLVAAIGGIRPLHALQDRNADHQATASVAGHWTLSIKGSPHGDVTMGLALEQKGRRVTGTFATPHGELQVSGEFTEGELTLATPAGGDPRITLSAKLKDDTTLDGYLSSEMGDMTWTATRAAGR